MIRKYFLFCVFPNIHFLSRTPSSQKVSEVSHEIFKSVKESKAFRS